MKVLPEPRAFWRCLPALLALLGMLASTRVVAAPAGADAYQCGGDVETRVWSVWDRQGRAHARDELVRDKLLARGDTYALYDLEIQFHNLLAMTVRCGRDDRLLQFAKDWVPAFSGLQSVPSSRSDGGPRAGVVGTPAARGQSGGMAWVCRGGSVCNAKNRLAGKEVRLVSMQGLALFVELANHLEARRGDDPIAREFIYRTSDVAVDHLNRWGGGEAIASWKTAMGIEADEIKDGQSKWLFTDSALWQIGIYADLAGLLHQNPDLYEGRDGGEVVPREAIKALLAFFRSRLSYRSINASPLGAVQVAELDRGYWRNYKDGRYAAYEGAKPPAECKPGAGGRSVIRIDESVPVPPVAQDLDWDISHARRLVHVLASLDRNRQAMRSAYGLAEEDFPPAELAQQFSAQIVTGVWNKDRRHPLFSNWMSGANGWYRVAYDNRTGRCVRGFPPYGLSNAFATGGYITWARFYPLLASLGQAIYGASQSTKGDAGTYIHAYYPRLAFKVGDTPSQVQVIERLMFWPTLVESASRVH